MTSRRLSLAIVSGAFALTAGFASAAPGARPNVAFRPATIGLFGRTAVTVTGLSARSVDVRLKGATDAAGLAYEWTPYPWRRLRLSDGAWTGSLPAPALLGIYELELRVDGHRRVIRSASWLLHVFPPQPPAPSTFSRPVMVVRNFVDRLSGDEVVVALRRLRPAAYDHRDPRLHRIFVVAYAPRSDTRLSSRLGLFVTAVRDGLHGRWRLLDASVEPDG